MSRKSRVGRTQPAGKGCGQRCQTNTQGRGLRPCGELPRAGRALPARPRSLSAHVSFSEPRCGVSPPPRFCCADGRWEAAGTSVPSRAVPHPGHRPRPPAPVGLCFEPGGFREAATWRQPGRHPQGHAHSCAGTASCTIPRAWPTTAAAAGRQRRLYGHSVWLPESALQLT